MNALVMALAVVFAQCLVMLFVGVYDALRQRERLARVASEATAPAGSAALLDLAGRLVEVDQRLRANHERLSGVEGQANAAGLCRRAIIEVRALAARLAETGAIEPVHAQGLAEACAELASLGEPAQDPAAQANEAASG